MIAANPLDWYSFCRLERVKVRPIDCERDQSWNRSSLTRLLTWNIGDSICIGPHIEVFVLDAGRGRVKLGFAGPRSIPIRRGELADPGTLPEHESAAVMRPLSGAQTRERRTASAPLRGFRVVA